MLTNFDDVYDKDYLLRDELSNIKICRIATVSYYMVSQLKSQAEFLRDIGLNVVLISSDGKELSNLELDNRLRHEVVEIPRSLHPWKDFVAFINLMRVFKKNRFDITHSTTPKAGLLSAIVAFLNRVPVRLHTWTGQPWVTIKSSAIRSVYKLADRIIGVLNVRCYADSNSQRELLIQEGIVSDKKIVVIGHGSLAGVDLKRFDSLRWSLSDKKQLKNELSIGPASKVLIFVGRITAEKGISELVSSFRRLLRFGYEVDLLMLGPLDEECGGRSSIKIDEIKRYPRIHYIGYTECPERYLAISDILCLPSYREGFGTVVIEAAAMGIPTIGTRINGLIDAIVDGQTGMLVPPRDAKLFFLALKQLLDNPDLLNRMGRAARQRCIQQFDSDIVNVKVAEEYRHLLKEIRA